MSSPMDSSRTGASALHLIAVLGDVLARGQATHAKEEYALSQIVASLKFVNQTIDAWVDSSEVQQPESSEFHVYESDLSAVSKSIDAILSEARLVRGTSKRSATPKGTLTTSDHAMSDTPRKSKAADIKKTLERFSQALHMKPTKTVSADHGEHSSLSAAHEMLLKWMETRKVGWTNTNAAEQRCHHLAKQSPCVDDHLDKCSPRRKFLDSLWSLHSTPAEDDATPGDLIEMASVDDYSIPSSAQAQVEALTQNMQRNVKELQAHYKLINKRQEFSALLRVGGRHSHTTVSRELELQTREHLVDNEEESAVYDDAWLPEKVCWRVLGRLLNQRRFPSAPNHSFQNIITTPKPFALPDAGTQGKEMVMECQTQVAPTMYSLPQQPAATVRLIHSIRSNIFHCHLQSLLSDCFLLEWSAQSSNRTDDLLSSSSVYMCFRLAHCLVCSNGKALLSIARRVDIT